MIMHRRTWHDAALGRYIVTDHPWAGLGWLIGAAASWLVEDRPSYVYMSNHFYHPRDGSDSSNKWEWFFDQQLMGIPYEIRNGRNHYEIRNNYPLELTTVNHYRRLINEQWTIKPAIIEKARRFVPSPENTLGVHYRGTDKFAEVPRPDIDYMADTILKKKKELGLQHVLLATDDERALTKLRVKLPFPLQWFIPHIRGETDMGIHQQFGGYKQALETMIEIVAIGMTKHLLVGRSSVADAMLLLSDQDSTYNYYN